MFDAGRHHGLYSGAIHIVELWPEIVIERWIDETAWRVRRQTRHRRESHRLGGGVDQRPGGERRVAAPRRRPAPHDPNAEGGPDGHHRLSMPHPVVWQRARAPPHAPSPE